MSALFTVMARAIFLSLLRDENRDHCLYYQYEIWQIFSLDGVIYVRWKVVLQYPRNIPIAGLYEAVWGYFDRDSNGINFVCETGEDNQS
jgi:hypothetical protein